MRSLKPLMSQSAYPGDVRRIQLSTKRAHSCRALAISTRDCPRNEVQRPVDHWTRDRHVCCCRLTAATQRTTAEWCRNSGYRRPDHRGAPATARLRRGTGQRITTLARLPGLAAVAAGLVWLHWHDEDQLNAALDAVDTQGLTELRRRLDGTQGTIAALRFVQMAGTETQPALLQLAVMPEAWDVPSS